MLQKAEERRQLVDKYQYTRSKRACDTHTERFYKNVPQNRVSFYKGIFIWHKSSGIPTGDKNIVDRHEYVLVFSKKENLIINTEIQKSFKDYKNEDICGGAFWNINRKAGSVGKSIYTPRYISQRSCKENNFNDNQGRRNCPRSIPRQRDVTHIVAAVRQELCGI